jgi:hypothetical protein
MQLTLRALINEDDGTTNMLVLKAMTRRRAMAETGAASPRAIRDALSYYRDHIEAQQCAWKMRHGVEVAVTMVSPYGKLPECGVRRSAF